MIADSLVAPKAVDGDHAGTGRALDGHDTEWQVEELDEVIAPSITITPQTLAQFMISVYLPIYVGRVPINHNETMLEAAA